MKPIRRADPKPVDRSVSDHGPPDLPGGRAAPDWYWTSHGGWWGFGDRRSPLGDLRWAVRVISGEEPAETLNERPGSRTFRALLDPAEGPPLRSYVKHTSRSLLSAVTHLNGSEALRVRRLLDAMQRKGIAVPTVRLAATRIGLRLAENLIVMDAVIGDSLDDYLHRAGPWDLALALRLAARQTAALHNAGFAHGDLVPGNLIIAHPDDATPRDRDEAAGAAERAALPRPIERADPMPRVVFIDNDRTRRVLGPWVFRARFRNVSQMVYRLMLADERRAGTGGCVRIFLKHYLAHAAEPAPARAAIRRIVERKAQRRLEDRRDRDPQTRLGGNAAAP